MKGKIMNFNFLKKTAFVSLGMLAPIRKSMADSMWLNPIIRRWLKLTALGFGLVSRRWIPMQMCNMMMNTLNSCTQPATNLVCVMR